MKRQHGFTLIELMVGMVVGLLTTLVITQVMALAENQRRTTSVGSSAQVNGAVALYALQHEMQMAGYGISVMPAALGCPIKGTVGGTSITPTLAPIVINDGGASGGGQLPDTIDVLSSNKNGPAVPALVTENHSTAATSFVVQSSFSFSIGDLALAVPGPPTTSSWNSTTSWCMLFTVTDVADTSISNATSGAWNVGLSGRTPVAGYPGAGTSQSYLLNLGGMVLRRYSICNASSTPVCNSVGLRVTDTSGVDGLTTPRDAYADVVNLQALYGMDTNADGMVDSYTKTTPTTNAQWLQVMAVRLAIVARSAQFEKDEVTGSEPAWAVPMLAADSGTSPLTIKLSNLGTGTDWKHYRYRVYDTVVPLRNVVWNS